MLTFDFKLEGDELTKGVTLDLPLREIANEVKKAVETDLKTPKSFDNSGLKPLSPKYAAYKRKKLGHSRIFDAFRKGKNKLINSVIVKKISNSEYWVTMSNEKQNMIMAKLQSQGRKGFGITETTINRILEFVKNKIKIR